MPTIWAKKRYRVTGPAPGLASVVPRARYVVAERPGDVGWYVAEVVGGELVARYRFGIRLAAIACRDELARGEHT